MTTGATAVSTELTERLCANIPPELKALSQWVVWKAEQRDGKATKVPYSAKTGQRARANDPATWATFEDACRACDSGEYEGLMLALSEHDPYTGIDMDKCVEDGETDAQRAEWVLELDSYSEYSPSGTGIHVIVRATKPGPRCKNSALGVEMYDDVRFLTMTGNRVPGTPKPIMQRQAAIDKIYDEWFPAGASDGAAPLPPQPIDIDDEQLLEAMFSNPKNGSAIRALWDGNITSHGSQSEADMALCSHLAYYTGRDAERMDRLFRASGLYRDKWERRDYRAGTIEKAIEKTTNVYEPWRPGTNGADPLLDEVDAMLDMVYMAPEDDSQGDSLDDAVEPSPLDIDPIDSLSLGWVDEYAEITTEMTGSPYEFNRLNGLIAVATAIQRRARVRMAFGTVYPNIYAAIIAPSSVYHKTTSMQKVRSIFSHAMIERLLLAELATPEGLLKGLQNQSCGLILRDEIGTLFDSHNTRYLRQLKPDLTALYDCLPYSRRLSQEEVKVEKPYLSILGATTPQRFYESITMTDWMDGFLARWLFVLPDGEPNFDAMTKLYEQKHATAMERLAQKLIAIDRQHDQDFALVGESHEMWDTWQRKAARDAYLFGDDVTSSIVTRYSAYALKFAVILTTVNGEWGRIEPNTMQTAMQLADSYKRTVHRILSERENFGISGAKLQKVFKIIAHREGSGVTTKDIQRAGHFKKHELTPCLDKLLDVGAITREAAGRGWRYFPAVRELPVKTWR